jgi:hypothetical protein
MGKGLPWQTPTDKLLHEESLGFSRRAVKKASARTRFNAVFLALGLFAIGDAVTLVTGFNDLSAQAARFGLSTDLETIRRGVGAVLASAVGVSALGAVWSRVAEYPSWSRWALVVPLAEWSYGVAQLGFAVFSAQTRLLIVLGVLHLVFAFLARNVTRLEDKPVA